MKTVVVLLLLGLTFGGIWYFLRMEHGAKHTGPDPYAGESITLGGSKSVVTTIGAELANAYQEAYPERSIEMYEPSHTGGALQATDAEILHLGFTSRPPTDEETASLPSLSYEVPIKDGLVFAVSNNVSVIDLTADQVRSIYAGEITNWSELGGVNAPIVVFDRSEESSPKVTLRKQLAFFPEDFTITGQAIVLGTPDEMDEALSTTPNAIGYTSFGSIQLNELPVSLVTLDGVTPTPETIASGDFPLFREMGFVVKDEPSGMLKDFIAFLYSNQGRTLIESTGFVPTF